MNTGLCSVPGPCKTSSDECVLSRLSASDVRQIHLRVSECVRVDFGEEGNNSSNTGKVADTSVVCHFIFASHLSIYRTLLGTGAAC